MTVSAKKYQLLDAIPMDSSNDRHFINSAFFIFFTEKKIRKLVKKGHSRHAILDQFRASNKFELMRNIYEYRVLFDNEGALKVRIRDFGHTFRVKFNNWFRANVPKSKD